MYTQQLAVPSVPHHYPGFDSVYTGVPQYPQLDATYSLLGGTQQVDSVVNTASDAVVTEAKFEAKEEILSQPIGLPSPAPTTTEAPTSKLTSLFN